MQYGLLMKCGLIVSNGVVDGRFGCCVVLVDDDHDASELMDGIAVRSAPGAVCIEHGETFRKGASEIVAFEVPPVRFADLAAAGDRETEVERVADQQPFVHAAVQAMLARPIDCA